MLDGDILFSLPNDLSRFPPTHIIPIFSTTDLLQTILLLSTILYPSDDFLLRLFGGFWTLFRPSNELPYFSIVLFFTQRQSKITAYRRPSIFDYCSLDNILKSYLQMYLSVNLWKNSMKYIYGSLLKQYYLCCVNNHFTCALESVSVY